MIYLNNSATSYPKPESVIRELSRSLALLPGGQFRSSGAGKDIFTDCRRNLGKLLSISDYERIMFTSGSTEALNWIISGLELKRSQFVITVTEHNSVLRVVYNLDNGEEPVVIGCDKYGFISPDKFDNDITKALQEGRDLKACVVNHCSNVTGAIQPVKELAKIAKKHGLLFFIDISQSAGCIPVDVDGWDVDGIAFTGHKSLMGPQGTGGFYVKQDIQLKPLMYGGTGRDSSVIEYSEGKTYEYEVGTQNSCGIYGLNAGVLEVLNRGVSSIMKHEREQTDYIVSRLLQLENVTVYRQQTGEYGPVVSFNINGFKPSDISYILQNVYEIITRAGLHCAPLIHKWIGCDDGTIRVSPGIFTTIEEIDELIKAVTDIVNN